MVAPRRLGELVGTAEPLAVLTAPAPPVHPRPPALVVTAQEGASDDARTLQLHLTSPRQAGRLHLSGASDTQIIATNFADAPLTAIEGNEVLTAGLPRRGYRHTRPGARPGAGQLHVDRPLERTTRNSRRTFPPATVMSASVGEDLSTYPTLVRTSYIHATLE